MAIFLGIDVGTGSARAGLFTDSGKMLAAASTPIKMWKPKPEFVEQSSDDIWKACCASTKAALKKSGIRAEQVKGIGFDATCSLVVLDNADKPVTVSPTGKDAQNVIVWMDHRAILQAERINAGNHEVLKYVGGKISPEMEAPKLMWVKEHLPKSWKRAARFFDLPDFLTYRATGEETRSLCSTVCKMTYLGHETPSDPGASGVGRWDDVFWMHVGLDDLVQEKYARLGRRVRPMGEAVGAGLTEKAAKEFGLKAGTPVGVSIIDAHAGGLGVLGAKLDGKPPTPEDFDHRLALIGGTSSCHMAVSKEPRFISGVWGPYFSAMVPGFWLTEGGQSATGALIDHVIFSHAAASELLKEAKKTKKTIYELLNERLSKLAKLHKVAFMGELTRELHIFPDFHGNRSPRADPTLKGMISGLTLNSTADELALLYLAAIQAVAHGTKHILDALNAQGYRIDTLQACGGGTKNPVFLREHAEITGCRIVLPKEPEAVLLGSAILGGVASGQFADIVSAMAAMNKAGSIITPKGGALAEYHARKHQVFLRMFEDQTAYKKLMS